MFAKLRKFRGYWREARKMKAARPGNYDAAALLRCFPRWLRALNPKASPLDMDLPWITFGAIDFLSQNLRPEMRVYEFGSGGSTLFFSNRVREVASVEHDARWRQKVTEVLAERHRNNCHVSLIEPADDPLPGARDASDPDGYASDDEASRGKSFKPYASSIDSQPDNSLDVVLIDGRARPSCLKHALAKTKVGGFVVLDNAEREHYQRACGLLSGPNWSRQDFYGPGPCNTYFWQTTIWKRLR